MKLDDGVDEGRPKNEKDEDDRGDAKLSVTRTV